MKSTIQNIWKDYADLCFQRCNHNPQVPQITDLIHETREKMCLTLNNQQKELLEKYDDHNTDLTAVFYQHIFCEGFSFGVRLLIEGLCSERKE